MNMLVGILCDITICSISNVSVIVSSAEFNFSSSQPPQSGNKTIESFVQAYAEKYLGRYPVAWCMTIHLLSTYF